MTETSDDEVTLHEVIEWAQAQSKYLRSLASRHVLWYLTANAFRREDNPERAVVGQVLSGRSTLEAIRRGTGLSERGVRDALRDLQSQGYIIADMKAGKGRSRIFVYWSAKADQMREDARTGFKPLLDGFVKKEREPVETPQPGVVIEFPNRQSLPG